MKKIVYLFSLIVLGCSSDVSKSDSEIVNPSIADTNTVRKTEIDTLTEASQQKRLNNNADFLALFSQLTNTIEVKGSMSSFIHENYGLYVISAKGVIPQMKHVYSNEQFWVLPELKLLQTQSLDSLTKTPLFEVLPAVICDTTIYDKEGCFAQEINPLMTSRVWNYANLNEKEIQAIQFLAETVNITVVNTANFTFYFSKIENKWHLTFIDLRIPCQV